MCQNGDFEKPKVPNCDFSTKSVPISAVFQIVRFAGDQKTLLTGESHVLVGTYVHTVKSRAVDRSTIQF